MHHHVEAVLQRALDIGTGERVVAHGHGAALRPISATAARSTSFSIGLVGVSTQISFVSGRSLPRDPRGSLEVDEAERQAGRALAHALEQAVGAAVHIVHRDDVVAGIQQLEQRRSRGQPEANAKPALPPSRSATQRFVREARRIVRCASTRSPYARQGSPARRCWSRRSAS